MIYIYIYIYIFIGQDTPQKEGVVYDKIILSSVDVSCTNCSHFSRLLIYFFTLSNLYLQIKMIQQFIITKKIPNGNKQKKYYNKEKYVLRKINEAKRPLLK